MHSRIFQVSEKSVAEKDYISDDDIPEWFCPGIADYVCGLENPERDRDKEISYLLKCLEDSVKGDGKDGFTLVNRAAYFEARKTAYLKYAKQVVEALESPDGLRLFMNDRSGGPEVSEKVSDFNIARVSMNDAYVDKFGTYFYYLGDLVTQDEFLRQAEDGTKFYIGAILDWHM